MSLFGRFGRSRGAADKRSESGGTGAPGQATRIRSLALGALFSQLVPGGAYEILDLGPAIGSNVQFLSRYVRSVRVGDLWGTLGASAPGGGTDRVERALRPLTETAEGAGYHGILTWDLLNYLNLEELRTAASLLSRALRPGGFLLTLIYYSAQMPAEPLRYRIVDEGTLSYDEPKVRRPAPRYPQRTLNQAFSALAIDRSYLLKTGLQEYLFVRPETPDHAPG